MSFLVLLSMTITSSLERIIFCDVVQRHVAALLGVVELAVLVTLDDLGLRVRAIRHNFLVQESLPHKQQRSVENDSISYKNSG